MKRLGWLVCKTFIEKKKAESQTDLFSFLNPSDKNMLLHLPSTSQDLSKGFNLKTDLLHWTHYSWFIPFLRSFPEKEACFFLSSLKAPSSKNLKNALKLSMPCVDLSKTAQVFFQQKMADFLLQTSDVLPLAALPPSSLNVLLELTSEELRFLIELLGLHDLAVELNQIIDNHKLKKIHALFSKEKEAFLKMLAHKKEPIIFKRMEISRWDGKADSLLTSLFQRGLNRLAKALYPEDTDFIWYIKHRMDIETAHMFHSLYKKLENPKAYSFLSKQVLEAFSFLRKTNPPTAL